MKTAVIYNRVSTKKQENDGASLDNQEKACREFCKNNDIQVIWVFKEAFTWKKKDRPIFKEAILNGKENNVNYFVVFDIDRFSREWYWAYTDIKEDLYKSWIELRDSKNIIQGNSIVIKNDLVDMKQYEWNIENSSEYAEVMMSTQAKIEWKKIIQRTIPREIELEQMGYKVRQPNFWYINQKIRTSFWKATIQVKHPIEWEWIQEIFKKRAEWGLTDQEIVDDLNLKWYKSRRNQILSVKQMQIYIKSTVYAWVINSKWTWYKPIKVPYESLISIKLWNQANRGKIKIMDIGKNEVVIEYNSKKETQINQPIVKERGNYNSDYCYSKVLKCAKCNAPLTASTSRWWNGELHYYYHCRGRVAMKHKTYSLKRDIVHKKIKEVFWNIKINNDILILYDKIAKEIFETRKQELQEEKQNYNKQYQALEKKEIEIIGNINKIIDFPLILRAKNEELEVIKIEKIKLENKSKEIISTTSLDKFLYYSKQVITHLDKLALQKEKPDLINIAFEVVFNWWVKYEEMDYHTPFFASLSSQNSQQKNPLWEEFSSNLQWQPQLESNRPRRIWSPEF
jgi:Resolvase, N terminal domain